MSGTYQGSRTLLPTGVPCGVWNNLGSTRYGRRMSRGLQLYRSILRLHRKLPLELRQVGDSYVRHEFAQFKTAKPEHLAHFFKEWDKYVVMLNKNNDRDRVGEDMTVEIKAMSPEQQQKMKDLAEEIKKNTM